MGFYTGLVYYRPGAPPVVTCAELAAWIAAVTATQTLHGGNHLSLKVKFGEAIDQDYETDSIFDLDCEIDSRDFKTVEMMTQQLAGRKETIYRAFVSLDRLRDDVVQPITRVGSPENKIDFWPSYLSLSIGPVQCYELGGEEPIITGCLALSISGNGYLYPWKFADVVRRLEGSAEIQRLMQACRDQWPVAPDKPSAEAVANRQEVGTLWPYDLNKPRDWFWGLQESG
ncbi:hypothetical protein [Anatilimnocola floriformis]|uniref:hypothetical protein n=1 Tax=Anatilimnocola floriformis TaxID=2948575 RepID=UPI0020C3640A|nr:hypothetical protein [Anatilimnocola floriformis]